MLSYLLPVTSIVLLSKLTNATCYWANSTQALNDPFSISRDDSPCFPSQVHSPCCGTGWSCLSDGVCYIKINSNDYYYRGTCTDKTWGSTQCPGWCFAQNSNTSIPLAKCKKASGEDWYCCPGDKDCDCSSGKNAVKLGGTQPTTVTVVGSTSWPGMSSTATATSTGGSSTFRDSTLTTGISAAAATSSSSSSTSTSSNNSSNNNTHTALAAGLGAGIGAAVLLLAGGGYFVLTRARKKRNAKSSLHSTPPVTAMYGPSLNPGYAGAGAGRSNPGDGYYATNLINEKDGVESLGTSELSSSGQRVEIDGAERYQRGYAHGTGNADAYGRWNGVGRHEMP